MVGQAVVQAVKAQRHQTLLQNNLESLCLRGRNPLPRSFRLNSRRWVCINHNPHEREDMFGLGTQEIILILLFVLIFFGAKKIPELAQGLGKGIREFRKAAREVQDDVEKEVKKIDEPEKKS